MLSSKQRTELLDALTEFNDELKRHQEELQDWERNVLALTMAICTCMLQQKVLKRDAIDILQKAVDQIRHYSTAKSPPPLMSPAQLARMVKQERETALKKLLILENMAEQGDDTEIRALYNEIVDASTHDDVEIAARLANIRKIMGWVK